MPHAVSDLYIAPYLVDVELALAPGQLPVAGGELPDEVVTADQKAPDRKKKRL